VATRRPGNLKQSQHPWETYLKNVAEIFNSKFHMFERKSFRSKVDQYFQHFYDLLVPPFWMLSSAIFESLFQPLLGYIAVNLLSPASRRLSKK